MRSVTEPGVPAPRQDVRAGTAAQALSPERSAHLVEFARACRSAARAVSLYPAAHPAIEATLARVVSTARQVAAGADLELTVLPDSLLVDGRTPARTDAAMEELAGLFHERMVGSIRMSLQADAADWHALLLLLGRPPADVIAEGGLASCWAATGRVRFALRGIDYAEVLRERAGGAAAAWDRIVAFCLDGTRSTLDERELAVLIDALGDPARLGELLERLEEAPDAAGAPVGLRAAAVMRLLRVASNAARGPDGQPAEPVLETLARACAHLSPDAMLGVLAHRQAADAEEAWLAGAVASRIDEETAARFVARSVAAVGGATERLAEAFQVLVPGDRQELVLDLARRHASSGAIGQEEGFEQLWHEAANMLRSYSDERFVSDAYARELSGARRQALTVERVSDDPPERLQRWLATVSEAAVDAASHQLLLDLLRLERDPHAWRTIAAIGAGEIERRIVRGHVTEALALLDRIAEECRPGAPDPLKEAAESTLDTLVAGPFVRHLVGRLRGAAEAEATALTRLGHLLGPRAVRPLAVALASEEDSRAIKRLRELLLGFGAAGRQSVEQLKSSPNPAVRRTAIDLLRVFGGREALPELAAMLEDGDPEVQRDSVRAIVEIGSPEAYAVLERAIDRAGRKPDAMVRHLVSLRDEKAVPPLCLVLTRIWSRSALVGLQIDIVEALGSLGSHARSTEVLGGVLHRGWWWAPVRTARLRQAAAAALRRIGSADAIAALERAAAEGHRGVRRIARAQLAARPARAARTDG